MVIAASAGTPKCTRFGPVITPRCHGDDAVIGGAVGTQWGQQDMHRTACPTSRHGVVDHALQSPLNCSIMVHLLLLFSLMKKWMALDLITRSHCS